MAHDRIEPPDLWPGVIARLLYRLVCSWSNGKPPRFADFFPRVKPEPMSEAQLLAAFGVRPAQR